MSVIGGKQVAWVSMAREPPLHHPLLHCPPIACEVKEDWRGKDDGIEPVQYAAVPFERLTPILHATVAFDCRHHEATEETHHVDDKRDRARLPKRERRDPPQSHSYQGCAEDAADETFDSLG